MDRPDKPVTTHPTSPARGQGMGLSIARVEAFADGVFAIVITLLILDIRPPEIAGSNVGPELLRQLVEMWPKYLAYALSFVIVGVYWVGHHAQFRFIRHANRTLLWINILFFMCVCFVPFSASLLGRYNHEQVAITVYGLNLIVVGACLYLHFWYATKNHRLVDHDLSEQQIAVSKRRILIAPVLSILAIALSFISPLLSLVVYLVVPLPYILPGQIDLHWSPNRAHRTTGVHPATATPANEEPVQTPRSQPQ